MYRYFVSLVSFKLEQPFLFLSCLVHDGHRAFSVPAL